MTYGWILIFMITAQDGTQSVQTYDVNSKPACYSLARTLAARAGAAHVRYECHRR